MSPPRTPVPGELVVVLEDPLTQSLLVKGRVYNVREYGSSDQTRVFIETPNRLMAPLLSSYPTLWRFLAPEEGDLVEVLSHGQWSSGKVEHVSEHQLHGRATFEQPPTLCLAEFSFGCLLQDFGTTWRYQ